ncbi:hypothetical protein [Serratia fonticola]
MSEIQAGRRRTKLVFVRSRQQTSLEAARQLFNVVLIKEKTPRVLSLSESLDFPGVGDLRIVALYF